MNEENKLIETAISTDGAHYVNKILINMDEILKIKNDKMANLKYKFSLKSGTNTSDNFSKKKESSEISFKKIKFNINLYNIKNFIILGIDHNRKIKKNLKFINHARDMFVENPISLDGQPKSIKTDIISNKSIFNNFNPGNNLNYEDIRFTLVSQMEFSSIPIQNLKINLEIEDELNEKKTYHDFNFNSVDFIVECQILKMTYKEMLKLEEDIKNRKYLEENFNKIGDVHLENFKDQPETEIIKIENNNMTRDNFTQNNLKLLRLLNNSEFDEKFKYEFKITDVDYILNGNDII